MKLLLVWFETRFHKVVTYGIVFLVYGIEVRPIRYQLTRDAWRTLEKACKSRAGGQ